jgi:hypothetical protein
MLNSDLEVCYLLVLLEFVVVSIRDGYEGIEDFCIFFASLGLMNFFVTVFYYFFTSVF